MSIEASGLMSSLVQSSGEGRVAPWNPMLWLEARQQLLDDGRIKELPNLMRFVRESSRRALQLKEYQTPNRAKTIALGKYLMPAESVRWLGRRNVKVPQTPGSSADVQPPVIVVAESPLDVIYRMTHSGPEEDRRRPIIMVVEATDFDADGRLNLGATRTTSMSQQNLLVRSDFQRFARQAASCIRSGKSSVRDHLTALHDPYVFACPNVTLFRGARDDGYPYLEKPVHFTCVVCAMPCLRPAIMKSGTGLGQKSEWYSSDLDQTALLERLCLIGYSALQDVDKKQKAILVLSGLGCSDRGLHPRDAVANSMKHWRTRFARLFHTVFLAVGQDRDLAETFDLAINRQLYSALLTQDVSNLAPWHWSSHHVSMHVNSVDLHVIADMVEEENVRKEEEKKKMEMEEEARQEAERKHQVECDNERRERIHMQREDKIENLPEDDKCMRRQLSKTSTSSFSSRQGSKKRSDVLDIHVQVSRAGSKKGSNEVLGSEKGSLSDHSHAVKNKIEEQPSSVTAPAAGEEDDEFDAESMKSPSALLDDFAISAMAEDSRHVSKTATEMQVESIYKQHGRNGNSNVLAPKISRYSCASQSNSSSRHNSVSDAHLHGGVRHSRQSMGTLLSGRLNKSNEKKMDRSRSGSLSGSSRGGTPEREKERDRQSSLSARKASQLSVASGVHSRRTSALEQKVRKVSTLGQLSKSGCSSARNSAFGHNVLTAQNRSTTNPKKLTEAQRVEQIRMDARRRLSDRRSSNKQSCEVDIESIAEDDVSPNSLQPVVFTSEGGDTVTVCTTTIELPSSGDSVIVQPSSVESPDRGEARDAIDGEEQAKTSESAKTELLVPESPKDQSSPRSGSQPASPRSPTSSHFSDKRLSNRPLEKAEEWQVRLDLNQLAAAFKDSTDRFWNSPRRKKMAPAPKPARRSSDIARCLEQQKAFETAMSEDLGQRQAEAEIKRAVKELGLDAVGPHMIPGAPIQPPQLQPPPEHKNRPSHQSSLRVPLESSSLRKSLGAESSEEAQKPQTLSPLRRSYLAASQRTSVSSSSSSRHGGAASARTHVSRDMTVSEAKNLKPDLTDAHKLQDLGQSGNLMTF
eukprot:CAMPEP_0169229280 /NCGR_PEP_ID=MMETSP1016-20121227/25303_1 /TAXON_ID=342587 /ORGANISM="Karlodinium micrum, Strain CCMP2283" /LENGTH=1086 /DNA_ID=CAMNT_0009308155 /DNA_START=171 /DNA_END=3431 /DNA_ORIENTATION=-